MGAAPSSPSASERFERLPTRYEPKAVEDRWYAHWIEKGYFHASPDPTRKPYTIVIPPPNVTGALHMGHALNNTLQDILIRFRRMQGYCTLWMPGTDHAGIATQAVVERLIYQQEKKTRHDLGREELVKR
ncbi:MAG: class I tRNA ligase family protein, partial [Anaerolineales bacterium]